MAPLSTEDTPNYPIYGAPTLCLAQGGAGRRMSQMLSVQWEERLPASTRCSEGVGHTGWRSNTLGKVRSTSLYSVRRFSRFKFTLRVLGNVLRVSRNRGTG